MKSFLFIGIIALATYVLADQSQITVTNVDSTAYLFSVTSVALDSGFTIGAGQNPAFTIKKGEYYVFNVNTVGHPFTIKTAAGSGTANEYSGASPQAVESGQVTLYVAPWDSVTTLYFQCTLHQVMTGAITVDGSADYLMDGQSSTQTAAWLVSSSAFSASANKALTLIKGQTYKFKVVNADFTTGANHPLWFRTYAGTGELNGYAGASTNGQKYGVITLTIPTNEPNSTLYYNCEFHASETGQITLQEAGSTTAAASLVGLGTTLVLGLILLA